MPTTYLEMRVLWLLDRHLLHPLSPIKYREVHHFGFGRIEVVQPVVAGGSSMVNV